MKKLVFLLILSLFVCACDFSKEINGREVDCIGVTDDPDPRYEYRTSGWNIFWGVVLSPSIVIPGVMLFTCVKCPTREKTEAPLRRGHRVIHKTETVIEGQPGG